MAFDPALPANGAPLNSAEMRTQLTALKSLIDAITTLSGAQVDSTSTLPPGQSANVSVTVVGDTLHFTFAIPMGEPGPTGPQGSQGEVSSADLYNSLQTTSANSNGVSTLGISITDPPTQSEVQAIVSKLDELINTLRRNP